MLQPQPGPAQGGLSLAAWPGQLTPAIPQRCRARGQAPAKWWRCTPKRLQGPGAAPCVHSRCNGQLDLTGAGRHADAAACEPPAPARAERRLWPPAPTLTSRSCSSSSLMRFRRASSNSCLRSTFLSPTSCCFSSFFLARRALSPSMASVLRAQMAFNCHEVQALDKGRAAHGSRWPLCRTRLTGGGLCDRSAACKTMIRVNCFTCIQCWASPVGPLAAAAP